MDVQNGPLGWPQRRITIEPVTEPSEAPVEAPVEQPVEAPKEPVPA